jgi:hypothetical protein
MGSIGGGRYAYLQLGRFRDAQQTVDIVAAQYQALPDKQREANAAAMRKDARTAKAAAAKLVELSQGPYPIIPATELCGHLLLELNRPAEAATYFQGPCNEHPPVQKPSPG